MVGLDVLELAAGARPAIGDVDRHSLGRQIRYGYASSRVARPRDHRFQGRAIDLDLRVVVQSFVAAHPVCHLEVAFAAPNANRLFRPPSANGWPRLRSAPACRCCGVVHEEWNRLMLAWRWHAKRGRCWQAWSGCERHAMPELNSDTICFTISAEEASFKLTLMERCFSSTLTISAGSELESAAKLATIRTLPSPPLAMTSMVACSTRYAGIDTDCEFR